MRIALLLILISFSKLIGQTSWSPAGAEWTYSYYHPYPSANGYLVLKYVSDSVINTKTYKKIKSTFTGTNAAYGSGTVTLSQGYYLLYQNAKLVHIYNGQVQDDTLFNFNANIGDKWLRMRHVSDPFCNAQRQQVTVLDTGSVIINSVKLKKLVLSYVRGMWVGSSTTSYTDTVYEKIGSVKFHLVPWTCETSTPIPDVSGEYPHGNFRCYTDNTFLTYQHPGTFGCYSAVSVNEMNTEDLIKIFPNPNNGSFKLQIDSEIKNGELIVFNSLGQKVHQQKMQRGENSIAANDLAKGLYHFVLSQPGEQIKTGKLSIE